MEFRARVIVGILRANWALWRGDPGALLACGFQQQATHRYLRPAKPVCCAEPLCADPTHAFVENESLSQHFAIQFA